MHETMISMRITRLLCAVLLVFVTASISEAQLVPTPQVVGGVVVPTCGTPPTGYPTTGIAPTVYDTNGNLCAGVTVSLALNTSGISTSANQTNGTQETQVVAAAAGSAVSTAFTTGAAAATITSSPANILGVSCDSGVGTGDSWCELFNATSGNVTLGSTAAKMGFKNTGGTSPTGGGNSPYIPVTGVNFSTAVSWACVTAPGGATTAPSPCTINIIWKQGVADERHLFWMLLAMMSLCFYRYKSRQRSA